MNNNNTDQFKYKILPFPETNYQINFNEDIIVI